jgi:hypothetical protein
LSEKRAIFTEVPVEQSQSFFEMYSSVFTEYDQTDAAVSSSELEYVVPRLYSSNTATVVPYAKLEDGRVVIFIENRDLPGVQLKTGSSAITALPAFRLDNRTTTIDQMVGEATGRMLIDFGVKFKAPPSPLGGKVNPSLGMSPETVHIVAGEVDLNAARPTNSKGQLRAVLLSDLLANQHLITDAQLLTGVLRLGHALGQIA